MQVEQDPLTNTMTIQGDASQQIDEQNDETQEASTQYKFAANSGFEGNWKCSLINFGAGLYTHHFPVKSNVY